MPPEASPSPKLGATSFGYDLARQFGHSIVDPRPALVPFTFNQRRQLATWADLSGVSAEAVATLNSRRILQQTPHPTRLRSTAAFREKVLITHRGLSGPAILQISSYWHPGDTLTLDLAPATCDVLTPLLAPQALRNQVWPYKPPSAPSYPPAGPTASSPTIFRPNPPMPHALPNTAIIAHSKPNFTLGALPPPGPKATAKAEVTAGGVDTAELDAKTMQSRRIPGLFFIGEVVDVTGWLGGYNFQWAWASGVAAGQAC